MRLRSVFVSVSALVLLACGSDAGGSSSAAPPEVPSTTATPPAAAQAPAPTPPGAPAPVVVAIADFAGAPSVGIEIVFHDESGAVLSTTVTDAQGRAASTASVTPAMATALLGTAESKHLVTWTHVRAGDTLRARNVSWGGVELGSYALTYSALPNAPFYAGHVGRCNGSRVDALGPLEVDSSRYCIRSGEDHAALASATVNGIKRFAWKKALPAAVGEEPVAVELGPWTLGAKLNVALENKPKTESADVWLDEIASQTVFSMGGAEVGDEPVAIDVAPGFAESYQVHATIFAEAGGIFSAARRIAPGEEATIDFGDVLPALGIPTWDLGDVARPRAAWTPSAPLTATDGGMVTFRWSHDDNQPRGWTFIVGGADESVRAPALPPTAAEWLPKGADTISSPKIIFVDSDAFADEHAFRSEAARLFPMGEAYDWAYGQVLRNTMLPAVGQSLRATSSY